MIFPFFRSSRTSFYLTCVSVGVLTLFTTLTLVNGWRIYNTNLAEELEDHIDDVVKQLETTNELYIQTLYGARAFLSSSQEVNREEWQRYYKNLGTVRRLPGLAVLSYVEHVPAAEKAQFLERARRDTSLFPRGLPDFDIQPAEREALEYNPILYTEPLTPQVLERVIGFDFSSEPVRQSALERARISGQPVLSGMILDKERSQPAFVMVMAVYDPYLADETPADRVAAYKGLVLLGFRTNDFFKQAFSQVEMNEMAIEVYDGNTVAADRLLYQSESARTLRPGRFRLQSQRTVEIADHAWTIVFHYQPLGGGRVLVPSLWGRIGILLLTNIVTGLLVFYMFERRR